MGRVPKRTKKVVRAGQKVSRKKANTHSVRHSTHRAHSHTASHPELSSHTTKHAKQSSQKSSSSPSVHQKIIDQYRFEASGLPVEVHIVEQKGEFVPLYFVNLPTISKTTELILERVRKELVHEVNLGSIDITDIKKRWVVEQRFSDSIKDLVHKYFPDLEEKQLGYLATYLTQKALGMGHVEILLNDSLLEEIAINSSSDPVWVYHRKHGWVKTNILLESEDQVKHFASMIGRKIGRQINVLNPLMDANLQTGDRVNATLAPISVKGHTITLRKFSSDPWTITRMLENGTVQPESASLIWMGMQYELSALICGGTATGKTSFLNSISEFFPPNQRIVSIEDTQELQLPKFLHWIPLVTRLPNAENKGEITMLDLLVNSLRMRPDRILVGEIRRQREAEVLFEAIHTGHSVYATFHANTAEEAVSRLTNPPINVPKSMLPALSMVIVQHRNRRTGVRKTFEIAEITSDAQARIIQRIDLRRDIMTHTASKTLFGNLSNYTGMTSSEFKHDLKEKAQILRWLVKQKYSGVDQVGRCIAEFYTNKDALLKHVRAGKPFI